jgi:hypothetical protein
MIVSKKNSMIVSKKVEGPSEDDYRGKQRNHPFSIIK